ncbi:MAG: hypothetical protein HYR98_08830 [Nitrospirae bacterium]|nr:hypothetical protein [Nitrospirota bacterium]
MAKEKTKAKKAAPTKEELKKKLKAFKTAKGQAIEAGDAKKAGIARLRAKRVNRKLRALAAVKKAEAKKAEVKAAPAS